MAPSEVAPKKRVNRKLSKRPQQPHRIPSAHVPERFKYGDDANEDVTAPSRAGTNAPRYMNQSIFSMIAAAGSRTDFNARFDESSDSAEEEDEELSQETSVKGATETLELARKVRTSTKRAEDSASPLRNTKEEKAHERKTSQHRLLKSLPKLSLRSHKEKRAKTEEEAKVDDTHSPECRERRRYLTPRDAPMMSRMLEAQAELSGSDLGSEGTVRSGNVEKGRGGSGSSSPATLLATRLMEIFGFDEPESVVSEYPCWLLQTVLLQGYLYITRKHICFYAYLPKKSASVVKSGYLSKRGRQNRKYSRYWFTLKGDVLSYYSDPSDLFFPAGNIDLRYGISASLAEEKTKQKTTKDFSLTTDHRTYYFKADSHTSAKEWVKNLQKVIFRSHNDGDSVKISLPLENVIDVEESPVVEFAETLKVRVLESGDSYAIDEVCVPVLGFTLGFFSNWSQYFFSFFSFGKDAFNVLSSLVNHTAAQNFALDTFSPEDDAQRRSRAVSEHRQSMDVMSSTARERSLTPLRDTVKATFSPSGPNSGRASPRPSLEVGRAGRDPKRLSVEVSSHEYGRASFDRGRRLGSQNRTVRPIVTSPVTQTMDESDSFVQSMDRDSVSSAIGQSPTTATQESASQILDRSDVFLSPTINRLRDFPSNTGDEVRHDFQNYGVSASKAANASSNSASTSLQAQTAPHSAPLTTEPLNPDSGFKAGLQRNTSSPHLQDIMKAGSYPLQRAAGFAGYLKNSGARMSKLLASESMGYLEKVSGMWTGGRKHYGQNEGIMPEDRLVDPEDEEAASGYGERFRAHFALPASEKLRATYFGFLHRVLPLYGKIYISDRKFCFRSLLPGTKTKLILPLKDIENVEKEKGFRFGYHGLVLVIRGHEELFFEFNSAEHRDDCTVTLLQNLESIKYLVESGLLAQEDHEEAQIAKAEHEMLQEARQGQAGLAIKLPSSDVSIVGGADEAPPVLFDDPRVSIINFTPTESLNITCLTIGSRGDVQPYIALCKGLLAEGHKPRIATHVEFEPWVRKHGIDFRPVDGDPAELMRICVENGMFTYSFLREASLKFRSWIDELLSSAWKACQGSDILIESPSAMAGIHIAEALRIPYFRAFTMPWTRTRAYPHAFAVPEHKIGGAYNYFSYVMFDNVFWKAIAGQVNRWRKKELGLRSTNMDKMQPNKVPFLYNFSPHVVVPPLDYSDWVRVTGYWFLDEASDWTPPKELVEFINRARADGKKLVYIGFGSIVVSDPAALTKTVVDSVLKADVRCILSKGWSDRLGDPAAVKTEVPLPSEILQIKSAPHDWLFAQIDAAAHHGGAGTTGASLRAGVPTIIKPFFGDQFFFGSRVEDLGVGICLKKLNVSVFSRALWEAVHSQRMIIKARVLGEQIRMVGLQSLCSSNHY